LRSHCIRPLYFNFIFIILQACIFNGNDKVRGSCRTMKEIHDFGKKYCPPNVPCNHTEMITMTTTVSSPTTTTPLPITTTPLPIPETEVPTTTTPLTELVTATTASTTHRFIELEFIMRSFKFVDKYFMRTLTFNNVKYFYKLDNKVSLSFEFFCSTTTVRPTTMMVTTPYRPPATTSTRHSTSASTTSQQQTSTTSSQR